MDSSISIKLMAARLVSGAAKAALGTMLLFTTSAWSALPAFETDPSTLPDEAKIELIRAAIVEIQAQLDQMQTEIGQNSSGVEALATQMQERMDSAQNSSGEIFESVNSVELKNELCFDARLIKSLELGGHAALGLGWSDVLELKAIGQLDVFGDFNLGLGHVVCIEVPLHSAYKPELELLPGEGESLHPLISNSALGAQVSMSTLEFVYNQVKPVAEGAVDVAEAVNTALTTGHPDDMKKLVAVETYTPLMPPMIINMIEVAPLVALDLYIDACTHIGNHPLMAGVNSSAYDWMCLMDPQAQMLALQALNTAVNAVKGVVEWLHGAYCVATLGAGTGC